MDNKRKYAKTVNSKVFISLPTFGGGYRLRIVYGAGGNISKFAFD